MCMGVGAVVLTLGYTRPTEKSKTRRKKEPFRGDRFTRTCPQTGQLGGRKKASGGTIGGLHSKRLVDVSDRCHLNRVLRALFSFLVIRSLVGRMRRGDSYPKEREAGGEDQHTHDGCPKCQFCCWYRSNSSHPVLSWLNWRSKKKRGGCEGD